MGRSGTVRSILTAAVVVIAAAAFWGVAWRDIDRSVLSRSPILDEAHYLRTAHELAHDSWIPDRPYYMSPLYSYLVAAVGSGREIDEFGLRSGSSPWGIRLLQALLWLGTAWLLRRVGRRWYGPRWGWLPPLLWVGYRPAAILAGQVLLEVPLTFTATAALAVAGGIVGPKRPLMRALAAGALVGAAALLRGSSALLLLPVVWMLVRDEGARGRSLLRAGGLVAAAVTVLMMAVPAVHNSIHAGRLAGPSLNGGVNLYIGNWSQANGFFHSFDGFDVEGDLGGAEYLTAKTGVPVRGLAEADRQWAREAVRSMTDDPLRTAGLWARKVWLHVAAAEIPQISPPGAWPRDVPVFRILAAPYGLITLLALAGAVLCLRTRPELRPWLAAVAVIVCVQSLFFVVTRYRLILVPPLALAATAALVELWSRRGLALLKGVGALGCAALAVVPWGLSPTLDMFETAGLDNVAVRWQHVGTAAAAAGDRLEADRAFAAGEELFRRSVDRDPTRAQAWRGLSRVVWLSGDHDAAAEAARDGLGRVSKPAALREDLIGMLLQEGRGAEAVPYLEAALADDPDDPDMLHNAAVALAGSGRADAAIGAARKLIAVAPDDPRGYLDLGVVLGRAGMLSEAREAFASGLTRVPGHGGLRTNLERTDALLASPQDR